MLFPTSPARHRSGTGRVLSLFSWLVLAATISGSLASCGTGSGDRLTVYSGRNEDLIGSLLERFAEESGISVDVRYGDTLDLALLLDEEGDASPADVFISQSPGAMGVLEADGRLATLDSDTLDLVDPRYRSAEGHWVGLSGRQRVLVYNQDEFDPAELPDSVFDLTDAAYAGQVAVAPSNASFQDFVTAMRAQVGDDETLAWLEAMAANDAPTYANNTAIVEAVGRGEVPMGLVNHYYNVRALADDPDLASRNHLFAPDDVGALVLETSAAVLATSDQADDAARLVEFLLGEASQAHFAEETFEYPLAADVAPSSVLPPLEGPGADAVTVSDAAGGVARSVELIEESGLAS